MELNSNNVTTLATNALLVELNIGNWTARKNDRSVSEEFDLQKGTKTRAGNYNKNLFAGVKELEDIQKFVGMVRNWHYRNTIPWLDTGVRMLPMGQYIDYTSQMNTWAAEFETLKQAFLNKYDDLVTEMAFKLGSLFNRDEYPTMDQVNYKFYFRTNYFPLPQSGDFRVDIGNEMLAELQDNYTKHLNEKVNEAMSDVWARLHETLTHLSERLAIGTGGEKKIFRDSLIENAQELCGLLSKLNVTSDPKLEEARRDLEQALLGVSAKDLRDSIMVRHDVHARVTDIIKKFDF
jgi:hypothetical protein